MSWREVSRRDADAEEQRGVVFGELDGLGVGGIEQGLQFVHRFFRDQSFHFAGDAFEFLAGALTVGEAMSVGRDHGDGLGLQQHQRAIQRVARLFVRNREPGARDQAAQNLGWNRDCAGGGKCRQAGEIRLGHADHLGVGTAAANADPVIFQQLDGDVGVGQQLHVVVKFARGDRAGAFFFYFGAARGAQAEIEVGRGERQAVPRGLE